MTLWLLFLSIRPAELLGAMMVVLVLVLPVLILIFLTTGRYPGRLIELTDIEGVRR